MAVDGLLLTDTTDCDSFHEQALHSITPEWQSIVVQQYRVRVLDAADRYAKQTGIKLKENLLNDEVKSCDIPSAVFLLPQDNLKRSKTIGTKIGSSSNALAQQYNSFTLLWNCR